MFKFAKKAVLAVTLAATALASATPAMADPYYGGYRHHRGGDSTGAAIAGGIIGLALGAIIVSAANSNRNRDRDHAYRRYDNRYQGQWRGQPTWQGAYNGDPYDQRYQGGQPGYSRDGYPQDGDGYYDRRGYRDPNGYDGEYRGN